MIVLQLTAAEARSMAALLDDARADGGTVLVAWDAIDRAVKVKDGIWSPPLGTVIVDD